MLGRQSTNFRQPANRGLESLRRTPDEPTLFILEAEGFFGPGGKRMAAHGFCVRDGRRRFYGGTHFLTVLRRWYQGDPSQGFINYISRWNVQAEETRRQVGYGLLAVLARTSGDHSGASGYGL